MNAAKSSQSILSSQRFQAVLSVCTLVYIFCSFFWLGRQTTVFVDEPLKPLRQLWFFFGLEQDWRLFGPEVRTFNCFPSAIVSTGGARVLWEAPHTAAAAGDNPYRLNLYRKFTVDYLPWSLYSGYWQRFSQSLAREFSFSQTPVDSVSLILNYEYMKSPTEVFRSREQLPVYSQSRVYFERFSKEGGLP